MAQHPDIVPALRKEVEFWSWKFYRGLDWYFAHFPQIPEGSHLQTGEACPGYLDFYETAERLREALPHIKLIVLLRNPVDRAISHYLAYKQALSLDSNNIEIYINLGDTLIHQKRIPDSLPYYENALDIKLSRHYPSLLESRRNNPDFSRHQIKPSLSLTARIPTQ